MSISRMRQITLGNTDWMVCLTSGLGAQAVNLADYSVTTVCPINTFSEVPSIDQWKSERAVFVDSVRGLFSWDGQAFYQPGSPATVSVLAGGTGYTSAPTIGFTGGGGSGSTATASIAGGGVVSISFVSAGSGYTEAPTVSITGGGGSGATASVFLVPTGQTGTQIAVYSGRVWISNVRTISYTAPGSWYDVDAGNAAGSTVLTEAFLRKKIYALRALENYLYIFGDSAVYLIGDLKVTGSVTTFSLTTLSSNTGTTLPDTIWSLDRAVIFTNKQGVYSAFGASLQKLSIPLDGIIPKIDFAQTVSSGLAAIYNILCYAVDFVYTGDAANRALQALWFNGKWFFTSQGDAITFIAPAVIDGEQRLYCTSGTDIRQMYVDTTSDIHTLLRTALLPLESPILDKQFNHIGLEFTSPDQSTLTVQADTENANQSFQTTLGTLVIWVNNASVAVTWINNLLQTVSWIGSGFVRADAYCDLVGKYLGFTVESDSPQIVIHGMLSEYEPRATWGP